MTIHSRIVALCVAAGLSCFPGVSWSFDYIEHSFFTDRACVEAQRALASRVAGANDDAQLVSRYLALALACPERWDAQYCADGAKMVEGSINRLDAHPRESKQLSVTLGDFAALPDHLSQFGPVRGLSQVRQSGLLGRTYRWMSGKPGDAGGVVGKVARQACKGAGMVPWKVVDQDVAEFMGRVSDRGHLPSVPNHFLTPLARAPLIIGPVEPSTLYSFNNPHYLDLVLRNHHHFGVQAYSTWLGFHSTAVSIAGRPCEASFGFRPSEVKRFARGVPGFEDTHWSSLDKDSLARQGCAVLGERVRIRLLEWAKRADPELVAPVAGVLQALEGLPESEDMEELAALRIQLDMTVAALSGLAMEGNGLHFLQDGFAGGHIRTIRTRGGLGEARYDHDHDNREGLSGIFHSRDRQHVFVAFGDSYLLGPALIEDVECDWDLLNVRSPSPKQVSACLLQHQRGLLVATSKASLLDWALGGTLYARAGVTLDDAKNCQSLTDLERYVCEALPLEAIRVAGESTPMATGPRWLHYGTLPVPPPPFSYESLVITVGFDVAGTSNQFGLQLTLLSELDSFADWMTSYRLGFLVTPGDRELSQFVTEFSYNFHWRWSARFLVEAGPVIFGGLRGFGDEVTFFSGLSPSFGVAALPEGWLKIPLEFTLAYRLPLTFFTSRHGFFGDSFALEAHWLHVGVGLAFM